jgi:hypothetical protein
MAYDKEALEAWATLSPELRAEMRALGIEGPDDGEYQGTALYPPDQITWHAEQEHRHTASRDPDQDTAPSATTKAKDLAAFLDEMLVFLAGAETEKSIAQRALILIAKLAPRYLEHKSLSEMARSLGISKQRLWCVSVDAAESLNLPEPPQAAIAKRAKRVLKIGKHPCHEAADLELRLIRAFQTERALSIKAEAVGLNVRLLSSRFRRHTIKSTQTAPNHEQMTLKLR